MKRWLLIGAIWMGTSAPALAQYYYYPYGAPPPPPPRPYYQPNPWGGPPQWGGGGYYRPPVVGNICVTSRGSCVTRPRPENSPCGCNIPGFGPKRGAIVAQRGW